MKVNVPVNVGGEKIASIRLDARRDGRDYTDQDREAMRQAAHVVAQAIEEDSNG